MKIKTVFLFCIVFMLCTASSVTNQRYVPVFMTRTDLEQSVRYINESRDLTNPGKIFYQSPYIFVNEKYKGIHIINNNDPQKPVNEGFIIAPGCIDIAVKDNILYLDNSVDLVAFNLDTKQVTERIRNVFPEPISPGNTYYVTNRPEDMILVNWEIKNN